MAKRGKRDNGGSQIDSNAWMVTFSDLLTLLLTFFVLLLTMASMDEQEISQAFGAFTPEISILPGGGSGTVPPVDVFSPKSDGDTPPGVDDDKIETQQDAYDQLLEMIALLKKHSEIKLVNSDKGIILELGGSLFFDKKSDTLTAETENVLTHVGSILKKMDFPFTIVGHSMRNKFSSTEKGSNVQISLQRAHNVMKYLVKELEMNEKSFTLVGKGTSESTSIFFSLRSNDRVQIIIETNLKVKGKNLTKDLSDG